MTSSLAVCSPSACSRYWAATSLGGYQPPSTCPLSVSHALRAFFRPVPAGLVSCRSRPWGSPFRVSPPAEPFVLSDVCALLRLVGRASFHPDCFGFLEILGSLRWPRPSFEEMALCPFGPSSGLCSLRVSVSPGRLFKPTWGSRPSWGFPPWGFLPLCR